MEVPSSSPDAATVSGSLQKHERLAAAALAISAHLDLPAVLRQLVEAARDLAGARYAAVGVFAEDGQTLREFVTLGLSDEQVAAIGGPPTGRGVLGTLVDHPDPLRVPDVSRHPDSVGVPPNHPAMGSFLGVPIRVGGEVFGRIYLADKVGAEEFTADDEALVSLIAAQAGVAVENARLYEHAQQRVRELEALNDVSMALAGQDDPTEVLRSVARAGRALACGSAAVVVVPDGDSLRIAAADGRPQAEVWRLFRAARKVASRALSASHPLSTPSVHTEGQTTFTAVPLMAGASVLGVLAVSLSDGLGEIRRRGLGTLASLAASSLRLAASYQSSVAAERRQRALFEVARVALGGGPLPEIVAAACERVLVLQKAAAVAVLWTRDAEPTLEVAASAGDLDAPDEIRGPDDLPGFDWVPVPGDDDHGGWLGVRLSPGDELDADRRARLEGWAGVISLAYRAERLRMMRRKVLVAEERSRIAMELHDGAVQRLFGVGMALQGAALMAGDSDARVAAALASAVDEIDSAITEIRAYVHDLRPTGLAVDTVKQLIADDVSMLSAAGISCDVDIDEQTLGALPGDVSAELVQVLAEACANMGRYSHATHALIRISRKRGHVLLSVADDGVGFDPSLRTPGHGLRNLRERAARMDGVLTIDSAPGKGAHLRLEIPL